MKLWEQCDVQVAPVLLEQAHQTFSLLCSIIDVDMKKKLIIDVD